MNAIRYWDVHIKQKGDHNPMLGMLNYYLSLLDVEVDCHDKALPLEECIKQINQVRQRLKYVVANAKEQITQYEVLLVTAITEHKQPRFCEGNDHDSVGNETLVAKVLKTRENRKTEKRSWKKIRQPITRNIETK
jgi:hypothetical protein